MTKHVMFDNARDFPEALLNNKAIERYICGSGVACLRRIGNGDYVLSSHLSAKFWALYALGISEQRL